MDDVRKRRLVATAGGLEDEEGPARKKAALLADRGEEHANGDTSVNGLLDESLEAFRKEAIWRQMSEYKRECERALERETALSDKLGDAEARALAVEACWNMLLEDARTLTPNIVGELSALEANGWTTATPLASLQAALDARFQQTKSLFAQLTSSAPSTSRQGSEVEDLRARCHQLSAEVAHARAAVSALDGQLQSAKDDFEAQHARLLAAEKRFDRSHSATVRELEARAAAKTAKSPSPPVKAAEPAQPAAKAESSTASVDAPGTHAVPVDEGELAALREAAAQRATEIESLYATRTELTKAVDELKLRLANLSESDIVESTVHQRLQARITSLQADVDRARYDHDAAQREADSLRDQQSDWRDALQKDVSVQLEEAKQRIAKHEADLARVRAQREEFKAEILELKTRDNEKLRQVDQIRTLANSRQDCITAMGSEVRRLKMLVRANEGDMEVVESLAVGEDEVQLKELSRKLKDAEGLALALRDQLKAYSSASVGAEAAAIIWSETEAREELGRLKTRLEHLENLFSAQDGSSPEVSKMGQVAAAREDRIKVLEANVKARDLSMDMLIQEVERLSTAWATLDEQNRDKVLALVSFEEKMTRLTSEKAKADNRYFAAMRAKEALQSEMMVHQKTVASQNKVIESLQDARTTLLARNTAAEKEVALHQTNNRSYQDRIAELESKLTDKDLDLEAKQNTLTECQRLLNERTSAGETDALAVRRLEEQVSKLERELANAKSSHKAVMRKGGADEELQRHNDDLTKMLKCNSCKLRFKSHCLTRCYHLVCKECIDERIASRQRKCPLCATAFGIADYQQVYF